MNDTMILPSKSAINRQHGEKNIGDMLCIVLSFNGCADTLNCLESLQEARSEGMDILVIDNASPSGVVSKIITEFPDIELIALNENLGWAGGNNHGVRIGMQRGYEWICLLNNDTVFPPEQALNWLNVVRKSQPCLLHPTIYYWDRPDIAQLNAFEEISKQKDGKIVYWNEKVVMNYAYGACLAVSHKIFESVGLFDERFFLQLEETDFYLRAINQEFKSVCDQTTQILHKESPAFGGPQAPIKIYYTVRNSFLLNEKKKVNLPAKILGLRKLYWTVSEIAKRSRSTKNLTHYKFLKWLFSDCPSARAVRFGVTDYVMRRFGRIAVHRQALIKN